jgi:hypothetical protein
MSEIMVPFHKVNNVWTEDSRVAMANSDDLTTKAELEHIAVAEAQLITHDGVQRAVTMHIAKFGVPYGWVAEGDLE